MKTGILFWVLIISLRSCKNDNDNIIREYDQDKRLTREYLVKDGKKNGWYKEFYPNEKVKFNFNYINDTLNGEQKAYYENEKLKTVGYYKNSRLDSIHKWYYVDGGLKSESFRLDGKLFGAQKEYRPNGNLSNIFFMTNDTSRVFGLEFDDLGKVILKSKSIVYCVYEKDVLFQSDSLKIIFYTVIPPFYECECEVIIKNETFNERRKCLLEEINNNNGVLLVKSFEPGDYNVGISVKMRNDKLNSYIADSFFLPVKVLGNVSN